MSLTLDTYSHGLPGFQAEAAAQMEEAIGNGSQNGSQPPETALPQREESEDSGEKMVSQTFASWNQLDGWLRQVEELRRAA